MPAYCGKDPKVEQGQIKDNSTRVLAVERRVLRRRHPVLPHPIPTLALRASQRRSRKPWVNAPHPQLPGLEASERLWTLPTSTASLPRQRSNVARSMSGALRQSRLSGRPRHADMIRWAWIDRLPKAANLNKIGEQSCATL